MTLLIAFFVGVGFSRGAFAEDFFVCVQGKPKTADRVTACSAMIKRNSKHQSTTKQKDQLANFYAFRGIGRTDQKDYAGAIADFNTALKLSPTKNEHAYANRGWAWYLTGEFQKSYDDFDQAVRIGPKKVANYQARAAAAEALGDQASAIADLTKAIAINPKDPESYRRRAKMFVRYKDLASAIGDYGEMIKLDKKDMLAFHERSKLHRETKNFEAMLADATAAESLKIGHPLLLALRAYALRKVGHQKRSRTLIKHAFNNWKAVCRSKHKKVISNVQKEYKKLNLYQGEIDGTCNEAFRASVLACIKNSRCRY